MKVENDLFDFEFILGQGPPNDRIKHIKLDQRISILTYTIMASLSAFGIFLAIGFFVFNIIFRTHRWVVIFIDRILDKLNSSIRFIRMSSPQINNLILAGCILAYTSILLMGIDSTLLGERSSKYTMNFICAVRLTVSFFKLNKIRTFSLRLVFGHYPSVLRYHSERYW